MGKEIKLDTERLSVIALDASRLRLLLDDLNALEKELSFTYRGEPVVEQFRWILRAQLSLMGANEDTWYWNTFWLFKRKEDNTVMGGACFKGNPSDGAVEIGYGINSDYEGWGYTTEAVKAMCEWAFSQKDVRKVIAETDKDHVGSQRVLQKCGMKRYNETEESYWWAVYAR